MSYIAPDARITTVNLHELAHFNGEGLMPMWQPFSLAVLCDGSLLSTSFARQANHNGNLNLNPKPRWSHCLLDRDGESMIKARWRWRIHSHRSPKMKKVELRVCVWWGEGYKTWVSVNWTRNAHTQFSFPQNITFLTCNPNILIIDFNLFSTSLLGLTFTKVRFGTTYYNIVTFRLWKNQSAIKWW